MTNSTDRRYPVKHSNDVQARVISVFILVSFILAFLPSSMAQLLSQSSLYEWLGSSIPSVRSFSAISHDPVGATVYLVSMCLLMPIVVIVVLIAPGFVSIDRELVERFHFWLLAMVSLLAVMAVACAYSIEFDAATVHGQSRSSRTLYAVTSSRVWLATVGGLLFMALNLLLVMPLGLVRALLALRQGTQEKEGDRR